MTEDQYTLGRSHGFTSGYWAAVNDVLNLLNTFEDRMVLKKEIYRQVSDLRPTREVFNEEETAPQPAPQRVLSQQEQRILDTALRSSVKLVAPPDSITDGTGTWSDGGKSWDPAPEPDAKDSSNG